jgi:hypothetical protein
LIDRRIDLDEFVIAARRDVARTRRDDAGRHRAAKPERISYGDHPFADARRLVGDFDEFESRAAVDLEQRDIGLRIARHDPSWIGVAVVGLDRDRRAMLDHVVGGHRLAIGGDKKAGPLACRQARVPRRITLIGSLAKSRQESLLLIVCGSLFVDHLRADTEHR